MIELSASASLARSEQTVGRCSQSVPPRLFGVTWEETVSTLEGKKEAEERSESWEKRRR